MGVEKVEVAVLVFDQIYAPDVFTSDSVVIQFQHNVAAVPYMGGGLAVHAFRQAHAVGLVCVRYGAVTVFRAGQPVENVICIDLRAVIRRCRRRADAVNVYQS